MAGWVRLLAAAAAAAQAWAAELDRRLPAVDSRPIEARDREGYLPAPRAGRCHTAIVIAGLQRSSTTTLHKLVIAVLNANGVPFLDFGYWALQYHVVNETWSAAGVADYISRQRASWTLLQPSSVVIYKSHEFSDRLASLCDRTLVFQTRRCLPELMASWIALKWVEAEQRHPPAPASSTQGGRERARITRLQGLRGRALPRRRPLEEFLRAQLAHYGMWQAPCCPQHPLLSRPPPRPPPTACFPAPTNHTQIHSRTHPLAAAGIPSGAQPTVQRPSLRADGDGASRCALPL